MLHIDTVCCTRVCCTLRVCCTPTTACCTRCCTPTPLCCTLCSSNSNSQGARARRYLRVLHTGVRDRHTVLHTVLHRAWHLRHRNELRPRVLREPCEINAVFSTLCTRHALICVGFRRARACVTCAVFRQYYTTQAPVHFVPGKAVVVQTDARYTTEAQRGKSRFQCSECGCFSLPSRAIWVLKSYT